MLILQNSQMPIPEHSELEFILQVTFWYPDIENHLFLTVFPL